jgi:hypothetical protein
VLFTVPHVLGIWAHRTFRRHDTTVNPRGEVASVGAASAALVRGGAALAFPAGAKRPVPIAYNVVSFNYRLVEHAMGGLADAIQPHHGAPDSVNPFGRGMPDYYQGAGRR